MSSEKLLLGAHMSIAGGFEKAIDRGESINCTAIQIFTKSNRQWNAAPITDIQIELFNKRLKSSTIKTVVAHASYLINIGSANMQLNKKSTEALSIELNRCKQLNIGSLIFHPGSRQDSDEYDCLNLIADNINKIFEDNPGKTNLLIENMAGMGSSVGNKFEQIAYILDKVKDKNRIGVCFDTCHAFASGYCFDSLQQYTKIMDEFEKTIGTKYLKAFHINDSAKECNSKLDRHAFIGKGKINLEGFKSLFNDERFFNIPKLLETPIINDINEYAQDLSILVNLIESKNLYLIKDTPLTAYITR